MRGRYQCISSLEMRCMNVYVYVFEFEFVYVHACMHACTVPGPCQTKVPTNLTKGERNVGVPHPRSTTVIGPARSPGSCCACTCGQAERERERKRKGRGGEREWEGKTGKTVKDREAPGRQSEAQPQAPCNATNAHSRMHMVRTSPQALLGPHDPTQSRLPFRILPCP